MKSRLDLLLSHIFLKKSTKFPGDNVPGLPGPPHLPATSRYIIHELG